LKDRGPRCTPNDATKIFLNSTRSLSHILLLKILLSISELKGKQFYNIILIIKKIIWGIYLFIYLFFCEVPIKVTHCLSHKPSTQETKPFFPLNAPPIPPSFPLGSHAFLLTCLACNHGNWPPNCCHKFYIQQVMYIKWEKSYFPFNLFSM